MASFSPKSQQRLQTCNMDLQTLFNEVVKYFDCTILIGHRGEDEQNQAFKDKKSKKTWPNSKHNSMPSNAVDVVPYPIPAWTKTQDFVYFGGFVMGIDEMLRVQGKMKKRIRYGGDFNMNDIISDSTMFDLVHFETIE
jgi:peptidoglycan L-alanyl-D-glutamate endopeptidase CwlK